ncbi:MAG TPA: NAD(P)/FAD-dependent oxidoreductase [Nitrospiria bacterium]|nr:NAD(P)/FAD-dependent oxidoreductase [Candidatus Manganitrophaceae bacterium]HIL34145.1 NAD(P)/FAD-dependent oxidoreductase [Candidatus Manganitrophaceae bacterium]
MSLTNQQDVIIIGAGAAGLMCALTAGQRGRSVLLLEHASSVGKKILISGGGRCNFTNRSVEAEHFISHNPHFCKSALSRFGPEDFVALVEGHKIRYHEKTLGQLFCTSRSREILNMLLEECRAGQVEIKTNCRVEKIERQNLFKLKTSIGELCCTSLVIATGGLSYVKIGASDFGYKCALQFGLNVLPSRPALVSITLDRNNAKKLEGLSGISAEVSVSCNGKVFDEAMLITHKGLSGPAILQISNYWYPGDKITINLLPQLNLVKAMEVWKKCRPAAMLKTLLAEHLSKRLAQRWLTFVADNKAVNQYNQQEIISIARHFHQWTLIPSGTGGYRIAEVTSGGIDTRGLSSKSFEATKVPGLYLIGEVLDVTGWLGGYNFQWAWSSGYCAGLYV